MGIYFTRGLGTIVLALMAATANAQSDKTPKNRAPFECKGRTIHETVRATAEDYERLARELRYANQALREPEKLVGIYKFEQRDEDNRMITSTIELQMVEGKLSSRLIQWGGRFSSEFEPVTIHLDQALIEVSYPPSVLPIQIRPFAKQKLRYAFSDSCALNFPTRYSPVLTAK